MENNGVREKSPANRLFEILRKIEDGVLVGMLLLMIGLATAQIFLRNFFESGIFFGDALVRILVLWIGLLGAMVAGRNGKHINIDVITRYLPEKLARAANGVVELFTAGICAAVAWYALKFIRMEYETGGAAFSKVPSWLCEAIIPFAFAVLAIRYLVLSFNSFFKSPDGKP